MIAVVLGTLDEGARLMLDKLKRTCAVNVFLVPVVAMGIEILLRDRDVERRRYRRDKRARREF